MLTQGQIEDGIEDVLERLELLTDEYAVTCDDSAEAEVAYRVGMAKALLILKSRPDDTTGKFLSDKAAEARALKIVEPEMHHYKIAAAKVESTKQALYTHRARLDALRTLAANVRGQT